MTDDLLAQVQAALITIPGLQAMTPDAYTVTRLGGLTNLVFRIGVDGGAYVLRLPGKGTEAYINRDVELHNATVAAQAGVSPEVVFGRPETGLMLTRCIEDIITMTPQYFANLDGAPERAGEALRQLHTCGLAFQSRFELFAMIDNYLAILKARNATLPPGYADVVAAAQPARQALADQPVELAPCHCDPLCENFLDDGERMWIVDWEYSGMNDPLWDLGDLSVEAGLSPEQDLAMLRAYFGAKPTDAQIGRMTVYKAMCDLLWTLWGLIQHADGNPAEDFWAYAVGRLERCKALMEAPEFEDHIGAVARG
ncbi:MAG TPA: choline/ethanolamine kinase family protein [Thermohalobaculum sp.]|nr:choline/ethanolamine kinase family protein [Thermohalobaculum sp.]